jgi:hypothetical protein
VWGRLQPARDFSPGGEADIQAAGRAKAPPQAEACLSLNSANLSNWRFEEITGRLLDGQASKESQLDDPPLPRIEGGQTFKRLVERRQVRFFFSGPPITSSSDSLAAPRPVSRPDGS